jgi:hypothetical protein
MDVPGLAGLDKGGAAEVDGVSCGSAGNCAAGGDYWDRHHNVQGFVVDERRGRWGKAIPLPGLRALNKGGSASAFSWPAPRLADAPPAGTTPTAPITTRDSS